MAQPRISEDCVVRENAKLVHKIVSQLVARYQLPPESFDEYLSAGYLGLLEAWERYDPSRSNTFQTYAFQRIRGAVIDSVRRNAPLSHRAHRMAKALEGVESIREDLVLQAFVGESHSLATVLEYVGRNALLFRLSQIESENEISQHACSADDPEGSLLRKQIQEIIESNLSLLNKKERQVLTLYYFRDRTFDEIGLEMGGLSKSWVSRLHSRALAKLKRLLVEEGFGRD
ncbi:MAG: sigma-70 family RNA polymerase sigma factor [Bdellovibrionales bacterium]|nr:sigma-70 family RNA polymerase sigma factor [Bdellovibrionales bacterium]